MAFELNVELAPHDSTIDTIIDGETLTGIIRNRSPRPQPNQEAKLQFGHCSLFDFLMGSVDSEPLELPVHNYLDEVLIGIYGASQGGRGSSKDVGNKPSIDARLNRHHLKHILKMDCTRDAVRVLFWIVMGIVTKRVVVDVVSELRMRLARTWSLVVLEVRKEAHRVANGNEEAIQDWILQALPTIIVQCIFRLMVDAFGEDRSQLIHFAGKLLDKITRLITYEVSGFRLDSRTVLEDRKNLFRKDVLDNPFLNQHDTLKSQMRREALEQRSSKPGALIFGQRDAIPMDETQLEHVMLDRSKDRVPDDLSVDRYVKIAEKGEELFMKHLQDTLPQIVSMPAQGTDKQRDSVQMSVYYSSEREDAIRRRENKEAEKRRREELLKTLCDEPLPAKLCERHLDTSWVSPIVDRLAPAERERKVLRKRGADSRHLKMELPALVQSKSEPLLPSKKVHAQKLPKIHGASGNDEGESSPGHGASLGSCSSTKNRTQISLDPPASLKSGVVIDRLKDHLVGYNARSFGVYAKTHDIASGQKKRGMDPAAMQRAETAYVASMHALVGPASQPALKLNDTLGRKAKRSKAKRGM